MLLSSLLKVSVSASGFHRADGSQQTLLEVTDYDFDWQLVYALSEPVSFEPEDELFISCTWDNSADNQPAGQEPTEVNWGEGSSDEMCVSNMYITEK